MLTRRDIVEFLNSEMESFTTSLWFREIDDSPYIYVINMDIFLEPCSNMCVSASAKTVILQRLEQLGIDSRHVSFFTTKDGVAVSAEKDGKQCWGVS